MASHPRYTIIQDQSLFHLTWQCHNKSWFLEPEWAKQIYYNLLLKYKDRYQVVFYSYSFMSSHPHLTGFCQDKKLFSDLFRLVNSLFAKAINKRHKRRGQVVMDRFKSPRIEGEADHLKVIFYNDLNSKRARMVSHPKEFKWSSFHYYAYGKVDPLITPAPCYLNIGKTPKERQRNYLMMVEVILENDWKEKKSYSSVSFIGDPHWVTVKYHELRRISAEKRKRWQEKHKARFHGILPKNE